MIDKLRELAENATPGPWAWPHDNTLAGDYAGGYDSAWRLVLGTHDHAPCSHKDARFIAAVNPQIIIKLLDVVAAAEKLERYVWANPGYPAYEGFNVKRLREAADKRAELASDLNAALAALSHPSVLL